MGMPDFYMISLKNVWVLSRRRISSGIPFPLVAVCIPLKKIKNHAVIPWIASPNRRLRRSGS